MRGISSPFPQVTRNDGRAVSRPARSLANHPLSAYTSPIQLDFRLWIFLSAAYVRHENNKKGGGFPFPFFSPSRRATRCGLGGHSPRDGFFLRQTGNAGKVANAVDKDSREALQVAKELTAKFIETRTVSPGNFAEIFPAVYGVVVKAIAQYAPRLNGAPRDAGDGE